jgi:hypothetical protein
VRVSLSWPDISGKSGRVGSVFANVPNPVSGDEESQCENAATNVYYSFRFYGASNIRKKTD